MKALAALLVALLVVAVAAGRAWDWWSGNIYTPVSVHSSWVKFAVSSGEGATDIGDALQTVGLIRSSLAFDIYVRQTGVRGELQAGDYLLNRDMDVPTIVKTLQHGQAAEIPVRLTEGYTLAQMAQQAQAAGVGTAKDYVAQATASSWFSQYDFFQGRPSGAPGNLEGFLFPDTYLVNKGSGAQELVKRQLDEFGRAFSPQLRAEAATATKTRPAESVFNIVILASMVEREANQAHDRPLVCDVYYNRLALGMPLGVDATIEYALGTWTSQLTAAQLAINSPYNTRLHAGLPPGPISNPSLASITACINPTPSNYLYYFTDPKGVAHFSSTESQFLQQQQTYGVG